MKQEEIISKIKSEVDYCEGTGVKQNPNYAKTQLALLDLIDNYMLSQFRDSDKDSLGQKKVFYNISTFPVDVASKMIDIDTKDIRLISETEDYWTNWVMEKELKFWMKDKYFSRQLNEIAFRLPRDGHVVLKRVDDDVQLVEIKNLRFRPDSVSFKGIPIIEKHKYQQDEFYAEAKNRGWENYKKVETKGENLTDEKIEISEAWFPPNFLNSEYNYFIVSNCGHVLVYMRLEKSPYKDLAWEKVQGRTLGRGQVEKLFEEQIYLNRLANYKSEGLHWSSKHMFQTKDAGINTNLLGYTDNGDILRVNSEISSIPVEERNLGFYNYEEIRIEKNAFKKTFSNEPVSGERAPSGTPYASTLLQAKMTGGYYDVKKENFASLVKEVMWDWIFPDFKKEKHKEHSALIKNILGNDDDSERFFKLQLNERMNKLKVSDKYLTPQQWEIRKAIQADIIKGGSLKLPKGIYDNLKQKIEITIEGEEMDAQAKMGALQTIFQMLNSNPAVFQDKRTRKIIYKMMDIAGFNPEDLDLEEPVQDINEAVQSVAAQRGGSISAPTNMSGANLNVPMKI